ncbi:MAG: bi-domain-containing oxidoreductase [Acidobacteriota bacterium]
MKQVLMVGGRAIVEEVAVPRAEPGRVLVRTSHSVLSAGTERASLGATAGRSLLRDATDPARIRRAMEVLRGEGAAGVLSRIRAREEAPPLAPGYAAAGTVRAVGRGVADLPPGTSVACAGAGYASHAEWIAVPRNLVVPVPRGVPLDEASFATPGAIALQAVRRSGIAIGECAVVLGLGLIGNLTAQILRAAGARVIGFDIDPGRGARCRALGIEAFDLAARDPMEEVPRATGGGLADSVLVCAASPGSEVLHLAMRLCRRKGNVTVVGAVGMSLDRSLMYEKELDLLISTSYGPGRYDPAYEEKGVDYPFAYVRWTENRNLAAFLDLIRDGRVRVRPLIDRVFPIEEAPAAYAALDVEGREGRPLGVVLTYGGLGAGDPVAPRAAAAPVRLVEDGTPEGSGRPRPGFDPLPDSRGAIGVGLIGAGAFVRGAHLPALRGRRDFALRGVVTGTPLSAREAARRFRIPKASTDPRGILDDPEVDLVLIGTRHHLHAAQALEALRAGKHVLVEKPLCLDEAELDALLAEARRARRLLAVGFNRRYSPLTERLREVLSRLSGPVLAVYRVNAGAVPRAHWTQDPEQGGGRILGECCHFVDLLLHLMGGALVSVEAGALPSDGVDVVRSDSFAARLDFACGSRGVLVYTGLGDPGLPKERLEIFRGGSAVVLDDFRSLAVYGRVGGSLDLGRQDKGIAAQWEAIGRALRGEGGGIISLDEIESATRATFLLDRAVRGQR